MSLPIRIVSSMKCIISAQMPRASIFARWMQRTGRPLRLKVSPVARASAALAAWDVEIEEVHHRAKVDAPSGTALRLADAVRGGRAAAAPLVHGREGRPGARPDGEIGMQVRYRRRRDFAAGKLIPGDEGNVGNADVSRRQPHHSVR